MATMQAVYRRGLRFLPLSVIFAILAILVVLPIGMLVYASFIDVVPRPGSTGGAITGEWYQNVFNATYLQATVNSLIIAFGGTSLALGFGIGLAWLAARTDVPGKALVHLAGIVPLFVSSLVGALAWSFLASPNQGFLNIVLRSIGIDRAL
jgi:iron(III) transport system permease protein